MAQTGFTPISLYYSATASAAPTAGNLVAGELAINTNDGVIYYKDSSGVVQSIASKASNSGSFTNLAYTGTLTGGTGVVNLGSGQFYKDSSGNVGIGTSSPNGKLDVRTNTNGNLIAYMQNDSTGASAQSILQINCGGKYANLNSNYSGAYFQNAGTNLTTFYQDYDTQIFRANNGTERMRIDSSGNVGIGTNAPATYGGLLNVVSTTAGSAKLNISDYSGGASAPLLQFGLNASTGFVTTDGARVWATAPTASIAALNFAAYNGGAPSTAQMTLTGGNVGIGTSSPTEKLSVNGGLVVTGSYTGAPNGGAINFSYASNAGTIYSLDPTVAWKSLDIGGSQLTFGTGGSERMRIDSSGNLLVGTTNTNPIGANTTGVTIAPAGFLNVQRSVGSSGAAAFGCDTTGALITFYYTSGGIPVGQGTIAITGTTTQYNTSSDYRLKENIAPMTGALDVVSQLKPVTYTWKADGSAGQGFIAHELAEVVPDCVTGEKDATRIEQYEITPAIPATFDEEGNEITPAVEAIMGEREVPVYQGIDTSFLVAALTAAIQELNAKVEALEAKLAAK